MSEKAPMQSTPFVSSTGETRNPIYEGQFDGETLELAEARRHWAKVAMEMARNAALSAPSHGEQVRNMVDALEYIAAAYPHGNPHSVEAALVGVVKVASDALSAPSAGSQEQE